MAENAGESKTSSQSEGIKTNIGDEMSGHTILLIKYYLLINKMSIIFNY